MEIKIDINTPYQIAEFTYQKADEATKEKMRNLGKRYFLQDRDFLQLSIDEFLNLCSGDLSDFKNATGKAFDYFFAMAFYEFTNELIKILEKLKVNESLLTKEQKQVNARLPQMSFAKSIMTFCQDFFNLQDFASVGKLKLAEFLLAKEKQYIEDLAHTLIAHISRNKTA